LQIRKSLLLYDLPVCFDPRLMHLSLRIDRLRRTFHAPSFTLDELPRRSNVCGLFYQAIGRFEHQEDLQMMTKTLFRLGTFGKFARKSPISAARWAEPEAGGATIC